MTLAQAHGRDFNIPDERRPLIVHVVRAFLPDSEGTDAVATLCRQLSRRYRIRVVTCQNPASDIAGNRATRDMIDGLDIVRIPGPGNNVYPAALEVFKHIADADLVHVHGVDFCFDALAWGRFLHRRPLVATISDNFLQESRHAEMKKLWFSLVTRRSCKAYSCIACSSEPDHRLFDTIVGNRATSIGSGADVAKFANCAALDARRRIVTIGGLSSEARLDRLLDVMQVLAPRHPDWHLDIIGTPSGLDGQTLNADIRSRGLSRHVSLQVSDDHCTIRNTIARASLFASASDSAGSRLAVIEAMSAGLLPVLDSNDAFRALARTHPALMLTDFSGAQRSAKALEAAFARLVAQGTGIREELLGISRSYAWDKVAERYGALYDNVLPDPERVRIHLYGELA